MYCQGLSNYFCHAESSSECKMNFILGTARSDGIYAEKQTVFNFQAVNPYVNQFLTHQVFLLYL